MLMIAHITLNLSLLRWWGKQFHTHNFTLCQHPVADGWMRRRPPVGLRWKNTHDDDDECGEKFFHITKKFQQIFCITCVRCPSASQQCHFSSLSASSCYRTSFWFDTRNNTLNFPENFHSSDTRTAGWLWNFHWDFFPLLFFSPLHFQLRSSTFFPCPARSTLARGSQNVCPSTRISSTTLALNGLAHTHATRKKNSSNEFSYFLNALRCPQHTTPSQL